MAERENGAAPAPTGAGHAPVARLLSAGAKGAGRVAHATGADRALNQAAEEAIVRALRSPAVLRALERAIESRDMTEAWHSEEIAQLVNRLLASDAAGQAWAQFSTASRHRCWWSASRAPRRSGPRSFHRAQA